jgi:hypothetical protein
MRDAIRLSVCSLLLTAACGGSAPGATVPASPVSQALAGAETRPVFVPPPGTVPVNFVVDDRANRVYGAGDLKWKGDFLVDETTRLLTQDVTWSGAAPGAPPRSGWPTLYDDGPWTRGGHEPVGARAGDHVWGVTVFATPPVVGTVTYFYGLIDESYEARLGNGWVWGAPNGSFDLVAGASLAVDAPGMTFPRFGWNDLGFTLDGTALWPGMPWNLATVTVKSSAWGWSELPMLDLGGGKYGFALSPLIGRGRLLPHTGLLRPGAWVEFVFVLGGQEYKAWFTDGTSWWQQCLVEGVGASTTNTCGGRTTPAVVGLAADGNTSITAPLDGCREDR